VSRRRIAAVIFVAGTVVGLYFATQAYFTANQPPLPWAEALGVNLTFYYLWALSTPLVIGLARRFRFESGRWALSFLVHAGASAALTAVEIVIAEGVLAALRLRPLGPFWSRVRFSFVLNFQSSVPTYWLILFVYLAFDYYVKYRDREVRTAQLAAQLSIAQLQALKMQLKPHFLFNTLNSISSLMYSDVEAADAMLTGLSEFLRLTLDRDLEQEVTLGEELEFVSRYLAIEKIRFEDRLTVSVDVAAETQQARVPTLALQPLVENAIHHGISPRPEGGRIAIRASRQQSMLHISIADNGVGSGEASAIRERVGLANTRARLAHLYGAEQSVRFSDLPGGGFLVQIVIPFRTAGAA
jgi:two-component system LytT family sensor kinase